MIQQAFELHLTSPNLLYCIICFAFCIFLIFWSYK